jgi:hypothetical protein
MLELLPEMRAQYTRYSRAMFVTNQSSPEGEGTELSTETVEKVEVTAVRSEGGMSQMAVRRELDTSMPGGRRVSWKRHLR